MIKRKSKSHPRRTSRGAGLGVSHHSGNSNIAIDIYRHLPTLLPPSSPPLLPPPPLLLLPPPQRERDVPPSRSQNRRRFGINKCSIITAAPLAVQQSSPRRPRARCSRTHLLLKKVTLSPDPVENATEPFCRSCILGGQAKQCQPSSIPEQ